MPQKPCNYCGSTFPAGGKCTCGGRSKPKRKSACARGYDRRWEAARLAYLIRNPLCAHCAPRITQAAELDHITPHRGDMTVFWDESNWQGLCKSCHSHKTVGEDGGFGNGALLPKIAKPIRGTLTILCAPSVELALSSVDPAYPLIECGRILASRGARLYESTEQARRLVLVDRNALLRSLDQSATLIVGGHTRHERDHWRKVGTVLVCAPSLDRCLSEIQLDLYMGKAWRSAFALNWWNHYIPD
jgi:5-methylcytosine-specific restriction protein A